MPTIPSEDEWDLPGFLPLKTEATSKGDDEWASPPREPTIAMLQVNVEHGRCGHLLSGCALGEVWRAMYDAAMTTNVSQDAAARLKAIRHAMGLLNSMVLSGEDHSDVSRAVVTAGFSALASLEDANL